MKKLFELDKVPEEVQDEFRRLQAQRNQADYTTLPESAQRLREFVEQNGLTTTVIRTIQNLDSKKQGQ